MLISGCPGEPDTDDAEPGAAAPTVRILVVDDEPLAAAIRREWAASDRGELDLQVQSHESLADAKRLPADCVIYSTAMLGEFAERRLIAPLPEETVTGEELNRSDIFPLVRMRETAWESQVYAVPFGSPALVVLYRSDVFERLGREPPRTWSEYHELALLIEQTDALAELPGTDNEQWRACIEPLGEGWAGRMLLARGGAYARHANNVSVLFDHETMEPLIDSPPFVRALEEIVKLHQAQPQAAMSTTPADARHSLLQGNCAMAITWPTRELPEPESEQTLLADLPLRCAPLPGVEVQYDLTAAQWLSVEPPANVALLAVEGRLGSVTSSARHTRAAAATLLWLANLEQGGVAVSSEACSLSRSSQVKSGDDWVHPGFGNGLGVEYATVLHDDKSHPLWVFSPRIPGRERYLSALDAAVKTALIGEKTPPVALSDAADAWREITAEIGLEEQKSAYAHSLGIGR